MHCIVPLAKAGFRILAASILPGVDPAPISVCISSMKTMISGLASISLIKARMRSSNCPRYFVPATTAVMSRFTTRLLNSIGEVWRWAIICASPSTMALLPTPGSPIRIGLFFLRRPKISITRWSSRSRPTTGSSFPSSAALVRSVLKLSSTGVLPSPLRVFVAVLFCGFSLFLPLSTKVSSSSSSSGRPIPFVG